MPSVTWVNSALTLCEHVLLRKFRQHIAESEDRQTEEVCYPAAVYKEQRAAEEQYAQRHGNESGEPAFHGGGQHIYPDGRRDYGCNDTKDLSINNSDFP